MLRALYDRTLAAAAHPRARLWLALVAFVESSVFPVPPDAMLAPMVLADRARWLSLAAICTAASVAGGVAGYAIGLFLFEAVGQPLLDLYGHGAKFAEFAARYGEWGAWIVFGAGLTPFPYKVVTIASGAVRLDLAVFVAASVLARGLRFFLMAGLLWRFGPAIRDAVERRLGLATIVFFALLIGGFAALKFLG